MMLFITKIEIQIKKEQNNLSIKLVNIELKWFSNRKLIFMSF